MDLSKRDHHCFISYASEDAALARRLVGFLTAAGLSVWFDEDRLSAGAPVLDELTRQIWNSRAFLLVLTDTALTKHYVKHEVDVACQQQVTQAGFALLAARLDPKLDPTARFPALTKLSWMNLPQDGELDVPAASQLLRSITPGVKLAPDTRHMFVSCGWGETEQPATRRVCAPLASRGVRLMGDAKDQKGFAEEGKDRVQRIMSGCTGHVMVLPERRPPNKTPEETYKYFLSEWEISDRLRLARRVFCVSRSALPGRLQDEAIEIGDAANLERQLVALHDETEAVAPHVFLAADYKSRSVADRNGEAQKIRNGEARKIIEHVLGMKCLSGDDYGGAEVSEGIVQMIIGANLVFADLACGRDDSTNRLAVNLNTCIEAGMAKGARRAVFLTALDPKSFDPDVQEKTRQLPFMFRGGQIHWYSGPAEFLATMHRLAMLTRRRILNDELAIGQAAAS